MGKEAGGEGKSDSTQVSAKGRSEALNTSTFRCFIRKERQGVHSTKHPFNKHYIFQMPRQVLVRTAVTPRAREHCGQVYRRDDLNYENHKSLGGQKQLGLWPMA